MKKNILLAPILLSLYLVMTGGPGTSSQVVQGVPGTPALRSAEGFNAAKVTTDMGFGRMPLYFIANKEQLDKRVFYYVQGLDKTLYFGREGLTFVLREAKDRGKDRPESDRMVPPGMTRDKARAEINRSWVVKLDFVGANPGIIPQGQEETGAVISYFKGPKDEWKTGLPTYFKVAYRELWPGIDLIFSGRPQELKHEFVVKPGADPSLVRFCYRGAESVRVNDSGELEVASPVASFKDGKPVAWQDVDGRRREVSLAYHLEPPSPGTGPQDSVAYGFQVGSYDPAHPLILDPATLIYCGYIGGSSSDSGYAVAVDSSGNAYVTGTALSSETTFPETVGPDLTANGGYDAFVAKARSDGTGLVYCGYIGGSGTDSGEGIAVDGSGNAYFAGYTNSSQTTFPETVGPYLTHNGMYDAFVAKVRPDGMGLVYCGFIGGSGDDVAWGIAVDDSGNAYVTGRTTSSQDTFPEAVGPDLTYNSAFDAFVAKVRSDGTGLVYCGYIGGSGDDYCQGIAVDKLGNAYVMGRTISSETTFPETVGPDLTHNGSNDAFVARIKSDGTGLDYCGYIGGSSADYGLGIAVDVSGNAYVAGWTYSRETTFPVAIGPDLTHNGSSDAFVAKVRADGAGLVYCGYIGGSSADVGEGIAVDGSGSAYVAGYTSSSETTFPVTRGPDLTQNGWVDAFVAKVRFDGTGLNYCGYIGGLDEDYGYGLAVDGSGSVYVTGDASSSETTFPETAGPDLTYNGNGDAFVVKISPLVADISLSKSVDNINPVMGDIINFTVTATNLGPDDATGVTVRDDLPAGLGFVSASASQGTYTQTNGRLWKVGGLANGSSASLTLRAKVDIKAALTNTATMAGVYEVDPNAENDAASVTISTQYRAYPPSNFQLERLENDMIFLKEYINRLTWAPNPLNLAVIVKYRLYRKPKDQPNTAFALYQELNASATRFDDRGLKKGDFFAYRITSVTEAGIESQPVEAGN